MSINLAPLIAAGIGLLISFVAGLYYGFLMGIRLLAKDSIILAFRTVEAAPERFAALQAEALPHRDFEAAIQTAIEALAIPDVRAETLAEIRQLNEAGIY